MSGKVEEISSVKESFNSGTHTTHRWYRDSIDVLCINLCRSKPDVEQLPGHKCHHWSTKVILKIAAHSINTWRLLQWFDGAS